MFFCHCWYIAFLFTQNKLAAKCNRLKFKNSKSKYDRKHVALEQQRRQVQQHYISWKKQWKNNVRKYNRETGDQDQAEAVQ